MVEKYISIELNGEKTNVCRTAVFRDSSEVLSAENAIIVKEKGINYESIYWDGKEKGPIFYLGFFDNIYDSSLFALDREQWSETIKIAFYIKKQNEQQPIYRKVINNVNMPLRKYLRPFIRLNTISFMRIYSRYISLCVDIQNPEFRRFTQVGFVFKKW